MHRTSLVASLALAASAQPHDHDRFHTDPRDHFQEFEAFVTNFDGFDDRATLG